jgi:hypothetical protein
MGNWRWRAKPGLLDGKLAGRLKSLVKASQRR